MCLSTRLKSLFILFVLISSAAAQAEVQALHLVAREIDGTAQDAYHKQVVQLVKEWRGYEVGIYVPLTKRQFLFLRDGGARLENGVFLGDIEAWAIEDHPVVPGEPAIDQIIRYKGATDTLLLSLAYDSHGDWGQGHILISGLETTSGRVDLQVIDLGATSEGDYAEECSAGRKPGETNNAEVSVNVDAATGSRPPRIRVTSKIVDCGTGKWRQATKAYLPSRFGVVPESSMRTSRTSAEDLAKANSKAIALYGKKRVSEAVELLEEQGIRQMLFAQPAQIPQGTYFEAVNNYAFFLADSHAPLALEILDSVVTRAPQRTVSWLNRAETYLGMLAFQRPSPAEVVKYSEEISKSYETYLALGGKRQAFYDDFVQLNPARHPVGMDICGFLDANAHTDAKLNRFPALYYATTRTRRMDVNGDGRVERLKFTPAKYGYQQYNLVSLSTDKGERPVKRAERPLSNAKDYGAAPVTFGGRVYFVYTNYATEIRDTTEHVVCEAMIEPVAFEAVDEDLCRAVIDGRITPKRFDSLPEGTWQVEGWTLDQDRRPGTALIDIDNDGKLDNIASLKAEDGRRLELASIGISPPALPADPTNELLGQLQYELPGQGPICQVKPFASGCRAFDFWRFDPFQYNDRTYIDKYHANDYGKSDRSIVELANGKVRRMCRLGYRIPGWRAAAVQRTPEK